MFILLNFFVINCRNISHSHEQNNYSNRSFVNHAHFVLKKKAVPMFVRKHIGLDQLSLIANELVSNFPSSRVFAFYGKMGSGKTTMIQEICKSLQSSDRVTSPSFSIVNEYFTSSGSAIYHFDFYRLKSIEEAFDLGYEDYFFSGHYCLIEWPEKIESLLPEDHTKVTISEDESGLREIVAEDAIQDYM
jgi:tRNA threonylcarbamoyladenosine biosynthesis protein TsaE